MAEWLCHLETIASKNVLIYLQRRGRGGLGGRRLIRCGHHVNSFKDIKSPQKRAQISFFNTKKDSLRASLCVRVSKKRNEKSRDLRFRIPFYSALFNTASQGLSLSFLFSAFFSWNRILQHGSFTLSRYHRKCCLRTFLFLLSSVYFF